MLFGFITLRYLTDYPRQALWLKEDERAWIENQLLDDKRAMTETGKWTFWQALRHREILVLCLAHFFANIGGYGFILWLPTLLNKVANLSVAGATAASALPFAAAILAVWVVGRSSDRTGERKLHAFVPFLSAGIFFFLATRPGLSFFHVMLCLSLTGASVYAWGPAFWVLPTRFVEGTAAAGAIGMINSIGNLGGFVGPSVLGYFLSTGQSYSWAVGFLSLCYCLAAVLILAIRLPKKVQLKLSFVAKD